MKSDTTKTQSTKSNSQRAFTFGGGVLGLLAYLAIGLLPSLVYGGYAGVSLSVALFGAPLDGSLISRSIVGFGMLVGVLSTAGLFVVLGAVLGVGLHTVLAPAAKKVATEVQPSAGESEAVKHSA